MRPGWNGGVGVRRYCEICLAIVQEGPVKHECSVESRIHYAKMNGLPEAAKEALIATDYPEEFCRMLKLNA